MAASDPAAATVKTTVHEEASRLPDTSWAWRRVLIFAISTLVGVLLLRIVWFYTDAKHMDVIIMRMVVRYGFGTLFLGLTLYGVGATVTDVSKLITAFLSTKKITETSAPPPARIESTPAGDTTVSTDPVVDDGKLPPDQRVIRDPR